MPDLKRDLVTPGYASSLYQICPADLGLALDGIGVWPELRLNGVPHYAHADVKRAVEFMRSRDAADGLPVSRLSENL